LRHLSGIRNYSESKQSEFQERLDQLRVEYKRWTQRCLELDPTALGTPGQPQGYVSKRKRAELKLEMENKKMPYYHNEFFDPSDFPEFEQEFTEYLKNVEEEEEDDEDDNEDNVKNRPKKNHQNRNTTVGQRKKGTRFQNELFQKQKGRIGGSFTY